MPEQIDATEEKGTPPDSSPEQKTSEDEPTDGSEPAKTPEEDDLGSGIKSYDERFKAIYKEKKDLERENEELKTSQEETTANPEPQTPDAWQPKSWEEVFDKFRSQIDTEYKAEDERVAAVETQINKDLAEAKKIYPDIDDDKIWDYMAENKIINVFEAVTKFKNQPASNEPNKQVSAKVGTGKGVGKPGKELEYQDLHNTPLDELTLGE